MGNTGLVQCYFPRTIAYQWLDLADFLAGIRGLMRELAGPRPEAPSARSVPNIRPVDRRATRGIAARKTHPDFFVFLERFPLERVRVDDFPAYGS